MGYRQIAKRLRFMRRGGELLKDMERQRQGRPDKTLRRVTFSDLGVTRIQSHRWQSLARMPDKRFEIDRQPATRPKKAYQRGTLSSLGVTRIQSFRWQLVGPPPGKGHGQTAPGKTVSDQNASEWFEALSKDEIRITRRVEWKVSLEQRQRKLLQVAIATERGKP